METSRATQVAGMHQSLHFAKDFPQSRVTLRFPSTHSVNGLPKLFGWIIHTDPQTLLAKYDWLQARVPWLVSAVENQG